MIFAWMRLRRVVAAVTGLACACLAVACHAPNLGTPSGPGLATATEPLITSPLVVERVVYQRDRALVQAGRGHLAVLMRSVDEPFVGSGSGEMRLRAADDTSRVIRVIHYQADTAHRFDSVAGGQYRLGIRGIGAGRMDIPVEIRIGCTTFLEVYVASSRICEYGPCPRTPPRATVTTCRDA